MDFWKDGISIKDLEKIVTCLTFVFVTLAIIYKFVADGFVDPNMTVFALGLGGLFVARKALKYNLDKSVLTETVTTTNTDGEVTTSTTPTI